jgi:response regulator RpfG family c-di-GMP phosphodiesterase
MENKKLQGDFFKSADNDQFPFIISQPLLSSLMMISFMQSTHMFHEKDIENMFLASYLKDFGMALVPPELYDKKQLDDTELSIMSSHASNSFDLLSGRIPMTKNHLLMIKNHHYLNEKLKLLLNKKVNRINPDDEFVVGIESTILGAMDIIVAMTHERPYRTESSMYQALEVLKKLMADEYPQEFKAFVMFIKQFLKN